MNRDAILQAAKSELQKHYMDTFVDEPPIVAQGGKGVVVTGCPPCRKRLQTHNQFMSHLTDDVLPKIVWECWTRKPKKLTEKLSQLCLGLGESTMLSDVVINYGKFLTDHHICVYQWLQ